MVSSGWNYNYYYFGYFVLTAVLSHMQSSPYLHVQSQNPCMHLVVENKSHAIHHGSRIMMSHYTCTKHTFVNNTPSVKCKMADQTRRHIMYVVVSG